MHRVAANHTGDPGCLVVRLHGQRHLIADQRPAQGANDHFEQGPVVLLGRVGNRVALGGGTGDDRAIANPLNETG